MLRALHPSVPVFFRLHANLFIYFLSLLSSDYIPTYLSSRGPTCCVPAIFFLGFLHSAYFCLTEDPHVARPPSFFAFVRSPPFSMWI